MNTILVILIAIGGRFPYWEPQYIVQYPTEQACIQAISDIKTNGRRGICVPEVKLK